MLFNRFDPIEYDGVPTADIYHHYKGYFDEAAAKFLHRKYQITGSPRPEQLSYQLYGDPNYHWVLLMLNNVYDPYYDWVMSEEAVQQYSMVKYQNLENKQHTISHHVDADGKKYWRLTEYPAGSRNWYDIGDTGHRHLQHVGVLVPVTFLEQEILENESRRIINILMPGDIRAFMDSFSEIVSAQKRK